MSLHDDILVVKGVGEKTKKLLNKLNIYTKADLLSYFPRDYDKYGEVNTISSVKAGLSFVICAAPISAPILKRLGSKNVVVCEVYDGSGKLELIWFNMPFVKSKLKKGTHYIFRGRIVKKGNTYSMTQPEILTDYEYRIKKKVLQPIYPLTKGITGNFFRKTVAAVFAEMTADIDYLPLKIRKEHELMGLPAAVEEIHFPKSYETLIEARKRLVFDEFFLFNLSISMMKEEREDLPSKFKMHEVVETDTLIRGLSFSPTGAQTAVWKEITEDLTSGRRMNRLVQGDVGSGKTLLAILACLLASKNQMQAAVMVPTEVLARQHFSSFQTALSDFGVKSVFLTGSVKGKERKAVLSEIESGAANVIIGTHALIQEKVAYRNLSLVITDEQHRFGVRQREKLMKKGEEPHVLVMSATPIPRTLAVILYGDLDISLVDELPAVRLPIKNCIVGEDYRNSSYHFIKEEVEKGHQAYIICPMVEKKEDNDELADVISYTENLKAYFSGKMRIAYLHGKMKNEEKNLVMEAFARGDIDILVSTTVVEVGVNVPNATVMMIENAERFGLSSLHQLRGRIGRGDAQSYCIFMSSNTSKESMERLLILKNSNDGFKIAEEDLKLRGAGDIFGIRQSGEMQFQLADILNDAKILKSASDLVKSLSDKLKKECYDKGRRFYYKNFIYGDEINTL